MNKAENFRIAVCVKQVPASILNPYDSFAVEAALQIRDILNRRAGEASADDAGSSGNTPAPENTVTAISMGIPSTEKLLRDLVARGVDEGVLLTDRAFAGADTIATASTLAMGIRETEYARGKISLIICGHMAVDGDTAQIGPELAETLNLPHVSNVLKITEVDPKERYIVVECIAAEGRQTLKVSLPALLTVSKDINVLRLPSIAGIRNADQAEIRLLTAADLNADPERIGKAGSATQVVRTFTPAFNGGAERITGTSKEAASKIREIIGRIL